MIGHRGFLDEMRLRAALIFNMDFCVEVPEPTELLKSSDPTPKEGFGSAGERF
jgi:hypothetical protein